MNSSTGSAESRVFAFAERAGADGIDRTVLPPRVQGVLAICDLTQEVGSGGFDTYLRYWGGDTGPEALEWGATFFGPPFVDVLERAMAVVGSPYPRDSDARSERLDEADADDLLDALDVEFSDLVTAAGYFETLAAQADV